jgi:hypothetical protein
MQTIILIRNTLDPFTIETYEADNVLDWMMAEFPGGMPQGAHIYRGEISESNEITPKCEADFDTIKAYSGRVYVVFYPGTGYEEYIIYAIIVVAAVAVAIALVPKLPPTSGSTSAQSPNNALSDRSNQARPNSRIPDIYGTVRSVPDLLSPPYKIFNSNIEVEYCYMCIGRGSYAINADDILDDATPLNTIKGASAEVYGPNTSPNNANGSTIVPQLSVGDPIAQHLLDVVRYTSVNGQTLTRPDEGTLQDQHVFAQGEGADRFAAAGVDFTTFAAVGDSVTVSDSSAFEKDHDAFGLGTVTLNGTYIVSSIGSGYIEFDDPASVNSGWNQVADSLGTVTLVNNDISNVVGPFIMPKEDATSLYLNFVCENGLYYQTADTNFPIGVNIEIKSTPVNSSNVPIGATQTWNVLMQGHGGSDSSSKGFTAKLPLTIGGRQSVQCRRTTNRPVYSTAGQFVDVTKWRDMYGVTSVSKLHFGNVTTIQTVTEATEGALAIKERKINMLVTRKLYPLNSDGTFGTTLTATNGADDALAAICFDPFIGNRSAAEVDLQNIWAEINQCANYFGTADAVSFCYTFDDSSTSFEESVAYIANAAFSTAFRKGNVIQLRFETPDDPAVMLFNHRNKIPKSETRSYRFGNSDNVDGVNFKWTDPTDESRVTFYIPANQSAVNPLEIESVGVRNLNQAWLAAWRAWNKIRYQNVQVEFEGTQEADLLVKNDRILVADDTRVGGDNAGEIVSVSGLTIELSQPFVNPGHPITIFLQLADETIQAITCTFVDSTHLTLATAPRLSLTSRVSNGNAYAITTYILAWDTQSKNRARAFLVSTKESKSTMTAHVSAINYDDRYYDNDGDYTGGLIH